MKPPCGACVDYDGAACDWCKRNDYRAFWGIETLATSAPVLTNYDLLISKTPEELAEWIESIEPDACPWRDDHGDNCRFAHCRDCWISWLKSPVEEVGG